MSNRYNRKLLTENMQNDLWELRSMLVPNELIEEVNLYVELKEDKKPELVVRIKEVSGRELENRSDNVRTMELLLEGYVQGLSIFQDNNSNKA